MPRYLRAMIGAWIGLALGLPVALSPVRAAACSPPPPTPWFAERLEAGASPLPPGVTLASPDGGRTLGLSNTSPVALYLIGWPGSARPAGAPIGVELPPEMAPLQRLRDGRAWIWDGFAASRGTAPPDAWVEAQPFAAIRASFFQASAALLADGGRVSGFMRQNRTGDGRPAAPPLPPPHAITLTLVYERQILTAPLTVSYALNPDYRPDSVAAGHRICGGSSAFATIGLPLLAALAAALLGWFLWSALGRKG